MKFKRWMFIVALLFSLFFSFIYVFLFVSSIPENTDQEVILYVNQVGLYKEEENAHKMKNTLQEKGLTMYIYKKEDVYVVLSGVSLDQKDCDENGQKLASMACSYLRKEFKISDAEMISYAKAKQFEKVLELMEHQSQRNASG